jgi:predicted small metal-binding protein
MAQTMRFTCLEPECGFQAQSDDDQDLIDKVTAHMAEAHSTFELEDVILANATPVADG